MVKKYIHLCFYYGKKNFYHCTPREIWQPIPGGSGIHFSSHCFQVNAIALLMFFCQNRIQFHVLNRSLEGFFGLKIRLGHHKFPSRDCDDREIYMGQKQDRRRKVMYTYDDPRVCELCKSAHRSCFKNSCDEHRNPKTSLIISFKR